MKLNIAVVDDEAPICEWLVYCIGRIPGGHHVISADNGIAALELIRKEQPDLVFTDIRMPGIDGLELMRQIREELPFTVFIILSNYAEFSYAQQALAIGAKDYVLKSELRSADIERIVTEIAEKKERSAIGRKEDVFPSGCIALHRFYSTQNEPEYARRFWLKQGMLDGKPYVLLCFPSGKDPDDWKSMADIAVSLRKSFPEGTYTAVASETDSDYLIIQSDAELLPLTVRAAGAAAYRGDIGISDTFSSLNDFPAALKQAACARTSRFFSDDNSAVYYRDLTLRKKLDRDALSEQMKQILTMISMRKYSQAKDETEKWFTRISRPAPADVKWAADSCRRMALSIEERYYQIRSLPAPAIPTQNCATECANHCAELLAALQQIHSGQCSAPVSAALAYIHEHYAEPISMAETARRVFLSAEYFSRLFKEEVGENYNTYLTLYRLDRAQEFLTQTDLRIGEIAEKVGYPTPGYFSRIYKRYKGVTPEQERASNL